MNPSFRAAGRSRSLHRSYVGISRFIRSTIKAGEARPFPLAPQRCMHSEAYVAEHEEPRARWRRSIENFTRVDYSKNGSIGSQRAWDAVKQHHEGRTPGNTTESIQLYGYITTQRPTRNAVFAQLVDPTMQMSIQLVLSPDKMANTSLAHEPCQDVQAPEKGSKTRLMKELQARVKNVRPHTPVLIKGRIVQREQQSTGTTIDPYVGQVDPIINVEVQVEVLEPLNTWPEDLQADSDMQLNPQQRHLHHRTNAKFRNTMRFRSSLKHKIDGHFSSQGFQGVETPVLFKSTPEGAREYIVPTRQKGLAYALPQSPQQYKQALMAAGVFRYYQFARCFRDEDLRADRQPEFTQLDLEMSFAASIDVMREIENLLLKTIWPASGRELSPEVLEKLSASSGQSVDLVLPCLTYQEAMSKYGIDKPDPRWGAEIKNVTGNIPQSTVGMLTSLTDPILDMFKLEAKGRTPREMQEFVEDFMKLGSSAQFSNNPEGMPGISILDSGAPAMGLSTYGLETIDYIEQTFSPEEGDILVIQARPNRPFSGGATTLGRMRQRMHEHAVKTGVIDAPEMDSLLWVVDFPLFSPVEQGEPGQGGAAGICSTHHPFTAPKPGQDLWKLLDDPLSIIGDHYDLVVNGMEIGGGSRRIHQAEMQELILRDVLKMKPERVEDFRHLIDALAAGCPPHAGFALGFDRLVAHLCGHESVRDVIFFPKQADGKDMFVGSPSQLTPAQLSTYHLQLSEAFKEAVSDQKVSHRA